MITLIDADSLMFKVAATTDGQYNLRKKWKDKIKDIRDVTWADNVIVGIKGTHRNFRYDILENYKGTRPSLDEKLKKKLNYIHQFALDEGAIPARDGWETDDECTMWANEAYLNGEDYCVAHIDKDLDLIPGSHYNYNKDKHYEVSLDEALYNFYHQLLTGDRSDNIPGVKGIGPVKASRLLDGKDPEDYFSLVSNEWYPYDIDMEKSARCLYMGDPELFTWDLRKMYGKEEEDSTGVETVSELVEEGEPVLHRDDLEDGSEPDELLRNQRNREELDGPREDYIGNVSKEIGVQVPGTDSSDIQS